MKALTDFDVHQLKNYPIGYRLQRLRWRNGLTQDEFAQLIDSFANLKDVKNYDNLFNVGFCRAEADWLVGMNGSCLFSIRYHSQLNTGRVQTPTLAMIVKRDSDVKNFVKQKYFTVELNCGKFIAVSEKIDDENTAEKISGLCNGRNAVVTELKKEIKILKFRNYLLTNRFFIHHRISRLLFSQSLMKKIFRTVKLKTVLKHRNFTLMKSEKSKRNLNRQVQHVKNFVRILTDF